MKTYNIKVTCNYYARVEANSTEDALEKAVEEDYNLSDLCNFEYEIEN